MKLKLLVMLLVLPLASCAYLYPYVPRVTLQTSLSNVIYDRNLVITNATGYYAEMEINCQVIGVIRPGDTFYSEWPYDFADGQAAVTLTFWKTADKNGFVGAAGRQFYNSSRGDPWIISPADIATPRGNSLPYRRYKTARPKSYSFSFPRIVWHPTTIIQIVNNTRYEGTVILNGSRRAVFNQGDVYCADLESNTIFTGQYAPIAITVLFDRGGEIATYSNTAYSYSDQEYVLEDVVSESRLSR